MRRPEAVGKRQREFGSRCQPRRRGQERHLVSPTPPAMGAICLRILRSHSAPFDARAKRRKRNRYSRPANETLVSLHHPNVYVATWPNSCPVSFCHVQTAERLRLSFCSSLEAASGTLQLSRRGEHLEGRFSSGNRLDLSATQSIFALSKRFGYLYRSSYCRGSSLQRACGCGQRLPPLAAAARQDRCIDP
jgi:hypothetical protein